MFAKARCAYEALAAGAADSSGVLVSEHGARKCRRAKARPDPDFKYASKAFAASTVADAMATSSRQGRPVEVCLESPRLCAARRADMSLATGNGDANAQLVRTRDHSLGGMGATAESARLVIARRRRSCNYGRQISRAARTGSLPSVMTMSGD